MTLKPCAGCGAPTAKTRCPDCQTARQASIGSASARGYDHRWAALSRRARRLQPFCTDCGTTDNLTLDHLPSAWQRKAAGKVIRLTDTAVVCQPCNSRRGTSRPGPARAQAANIPTGGKAQSTSAGQRVSRKAGYTPDPSLTPWTVI